MGAPKTVEERVGILEKGEVDCQGRQKERYEEVMYRVKRLENKLTGALGIGIILILTTLANVAIALFKN